jgi:CubicO group peptidase (beta-lactamase class C family)
MQHMSTRKHPARAALAFAMFVGAILACDWNNVNTNLGRTCFNAGSGSSCLEYKTWGQNIDSRINQQAIGYAYIIINNGLAMETKAFGKARTAPDAPETAMTQDLRMNAASVTKTMTAVAALKLLAAKNVSVTSSISPYLPSGWTLGTGVSAITFAELLTHTSGIRTPANTGNSFANLKTVMGQNITTKAAQYDNNNFAIFRIIFTYLNGYNDTGKTDADIATATDAGYLSYMKSVYEPDIKIACKPGNNPVFSYPFPQNSAAGTDWGDWTSQCGGGGLQLSLTDMGVFMARLMAGIYLPKTSNNANQVTLPQMVSNLYGWDVTWPNTHGTCVMKNGNLGGGNPFVPRLATLFVYCSDTGLGMVGLANSTLPTMSTRNYGFAGGLDDIVFQAYEASWQPGP